MSSLTRRDFIGAAAAAPVAAAVQTSRNVARKPNLLFLWTDEQRPDTMAVYGNRKIHAPYLNLFAGQSQAFSHAYVSQPVCTPSRSTVMTGLWPHTSGCVTNNIPVPDHVACLPEMVADSDYATGYFGKWHLGDEIFAQHGFQEWRSIEDRYRASYRPGRDPQRRCDYWHFLKDLGYEPDTREGDFSRSFAARRRIDHCKPAFLESNARDFLARHRRDPFILYVNFLEPHMPYFGPLNVEHDPAAVDLPPNFDDPLEEDEPLRYRLLVERYRERGEGMEMKDEASWRRVIANYWGLVTQVDRSVGAILRTLDELSLADNTIVVYTSDHGDMMGAHRLAAKSVMYEEAVRVPWLVRLPGMNQGRLIRGRFSHIDLVPTLLDLLGQPIPANLPGRSLRPVLQGRRAPESDVYIQWSSDAIDVPAHPRVPASEAERQKAIAASTRTIITQDGWKLCLSAGDKSQLFHLATDPGETHNLFYTGKHRERISELATRIKRWQRSAKDSQVLRQTDKLTN